MNRNFWIEVFGAALIATIFLVFLGFIIFEGYFDQEKPVEFKPGWTQAELISDENNFDSEYRCNFSNSLGEKWVARCPWIRKEGGD